MKKIVLLITILFISVISTACINNLAVQELNNKAKEYLANGETEKAICRLRSSIDLDTNIFETHYNLGVALITNKEFEEARKSLENAIELKPDFADSYYSLAVALEGIANSMSEEDSEEIDEENNKKETKELTVEERNEIVELLNSSVENYNLYLVKNPTAEDKNKVEAQIEYLNTEIKKYNSVKDTNLVNVNPSTSSGSQDAE